MKKRKRKRKVQCKLQSEIIILEIDVLRDVGLSDLYGLMPMFEVRDR